jgi:membrane associated rhomboid family serine protease
VSSGGPDDDDRRHFEAAVFRAQLAEAFRRPARATWILMAALVLVGVAQNTAGSWLGVHGMDRLMLAGALIPDRVLEGDWWRPWTGTLLHKDWQHLLLNLVGLGLLGRQVNVAYGSSGFIVLWLLASLAGASGTILAGHAMSVGASGGVFGLVGAFGAIGMRLWSRLPSGLRVSLAVLPIVVLVSIIALGGLADELAAGRIDRAAHLGGALGGMLGGLVLPLRLRDSDGTALVVATHTHTLRLVQVVAGAAIVVWALALFTLARRVDEPPMFAPQALRAFPTVVGELRLPAQAPRGVWREHRCEGAITSPNWALQHDHTLCVELPMGALLLVGRRDRLLSLDAGDLSAMRHAIAEQRFVQRQQGVRLHPVGSDHLYVLLAADVLLPALADSLASMLPVDATVTEAQ